METYTNIASQLKELENGKRIFDYLQSTDSEKTYKANNVDFFHEFLVIEELLQKAHSLMNVYKRNGDKARELSAEVLYWQAEASMAMFQRKQTELKLTLLNNSKK